MEVKLNTSSTDKQFVTGLGTLVPGEWTEFSDEQIALFETLHKKKISKVKFLETRKSKSTKKEEDK